MSASTSNLTVGRIAKLRAYARAFGNDTDGVPVGRAELVALLALSGYAIRMRPRVDAVIELAKKSGYGLFANVLIGKQKLKRQGKRR